MSGSGGGGDRDFRSVPKGGAGGGVDRCAISERANLNSPVAAVISTLSVGDPLIVELIDGTTPRIVLKTVSNQIFAYSAEVLSISGGLVEIEISPA